MKPTTRDPTAFLMIDPSLLPPAPEMLIQPHSPTGEIASRGVGGVGSGADHGVAPAARNAEGTHAEGTTLGSGSGVP